MAGVNNTFTGGTLLSAGRINVGAVGSLGTGRITLGAADTAASNVALYISGTRPTGNLTNAILVSSNGTGTVTIGSDATVTGNNPMGSAASRSSATSASTRTPPIARTIMASPAPAM